MSKLVSLSPAQFCRAAQHHQSVRRLPLLSARRRAKGTGRARGALAARPGIFEADEEFEIPISPPQRPTAATELKRLGWAQLPLEPEHLADRVADCLQTMDARYEVTESDDGTDSGFVVNADIWGVACQFLVTRDPGNALTYRISCTRLGGDTFTYHRAFRQLRELLGDSITSTSQPLRSHARWVR